MDIPLLSQMRDFAKGLRHLSGTSPTEKSNPPTAMIRTSSGRAILVTRCLSSRSGSLSSRMTIM